ncbi:MAG: phosphoenolpyruvate-utilizing N-terminal domain-containing protein, partial [Nitrospinales bacterium]
MFKGIAVSKGVTIGKVYLLDRSKICIIQRKLLAEEIPQEIERFNKAIQESKSQIQGLKKRAQKVDDKYAIILDTYILLLEDDILVKDTIENIKNENMNAEWALTQTLNKFNNLFDNINDEYLKGKKDDLDLVVHRIIRNLTGHEQESLTEIKEPVVIVAHALSPSDTLSMNRKSILGFATEVGGKTSH